MECPRYESVDPIVQRLALFDWAPYRITDDDWWHDGFRGFHIPFILSVSDDLLASPNAAPNLSPLMIETFIDDETGEQCGEVPVIWTELGSSGTDAFEAFIHRIETLFAQLCATPQQWAFFDVACGYFMKAFWSQGLEQMLWHITTIEALLGENTGSLTKLLRERLAATLGRDKQSKTTIRKQFGDLYETRSRLVHGDTLEGGSIKSLHHARNFARRLLLWFLSCLSSLSMNIDNRTSESLPGRTEILALLDLTSMDAKSRDRLNHLLKVVPAEFPHIRHWIE
jgi:hypothetical protein